MNQQQKVCCITEICMKMWVISREMTDSWGEKMKKNEKNEKDKKNEKK